MAEYKELVHIWNQAETEALAAEAILNQVNDCDSQAAPHILRAWKLLALMCAKHRDAGCQCERIDNFEALQWALSPSEILQIPEKQKSRWNEYMRVLFAFDAGVLRTSDEPLKSGDKNLSAIELCDDLNDALRFSWKRLKIIFGKTLLQRLHLSKTQASLGFFAILLLIYLVPSALTGFWNPLLWLKPRVGDLMILSVNQQWGNWQADKTVEGKPIVIAKVPYGKGIGTHAKSNIRVRIPSGYERIQGACGVPEEVGNSGSIVCQIVSDEKALWESPVLQGSQAAQPFDVPIKGLTEFELRVTDAGNGINSDHANWVNLELK